MAELIADLIDFQKVALGKRSWEKRKQSGWRNLFTRVTAPQGTGKLPFNPDQSRLKAPLRRKKEIKPPGDFNLNLSKNFRW